MTRIISRILGRGNGQVHPAPLLFLVCLLVTAGFFCGAAAATGSIYADTTDITGTANEYTKIPLYIDADNVCAFQFKVDVKDDADAKIELDTSDRLSNAYVNSESGAVYWFTTDSSQNLNGKVKIADIVVTPKTETDVVVTVSNPAVYEGSGANEVVYSTPESTLSVPSTSTNPDPEVFVDESGGTTTDSGTVDSSGSFTVQTSEGVTSITTGKQYSGQAVSVEKGSTGSANLPSAVKYYSADVIHPPTNSGESYKITLKVRADKLAETGKSASDIVVLHSVAGDQWYTIPVVKAETLANGDAEITIDAWSAGTYVLAYDLGGLSYPSEGTSTISSIEEEAYPEQIAATAFPTSASSVQPTQQTQNKSPFPAAGLVLGLFGAAGLVALKRRH